MIKWMCDYLGWNNARMMSYIICKMVDQDIKIMVLGSPATIVNMILVKATFLVVFNELIGQELGSYITNVEFDYEEDGAPCESTT